MVTINIRTEETVKKEAEKIFNELGLNMSVAINVFLKQVIREKRIPFDITLNTPNEITKKAIKEGQELLNDKTTQRFRDIDSLRESLDV